MSSASEGRSDQPVGELGPSLARFACIIGSVSSRKRASYLFSISKLALCPQK